MKRFFYSSTLIIVILFFSSCGRKIIMESTNWYGEQEYSIAKYLNKTEEDLTQLGLSGKLYLRNYLYFSNETEAEMKITLSGEIFIQLGESKNKVSYEKVNVNEKVKMTYTYKQPDGVLAAQQTTKYWHQPTTKFTISKNAAFLTLEIDNQKVIYEFFIE